ncbi:hypothetical protein [Syntrophothermus lipocalidus]|uniref:Uncharacterized protein n=1 Tax=Syntrophothermus lipocalidus (strain DSM 12680 / TGB-C1) TaxID=643648 RepID=D7CMU6_SYNLT|nr:hypothetical protein [Syntrophothermus lipocalidus]ADI02031.1 hypothetical protein Slip_1259 [Syntrophothermus lipocalidus DSM 12680]
MTAVKRTLCVFAILVATLTAMGPGYARWSDVLKVRMRGETGILAVGIRCEEVRDGYQGHCNKECGSSNVAWVDGFYSCDFDGEPAYESGDLLVNAGCPHYSPVCRVEIGNGGTIPARLKGLNLEWSSGDTPGWVTVFRWTLILPDGQTACGVNLGSLNRALEDCVLDPGQAVSLEFSTRCMSDTANGILTVRPDYVRWNKPLE